MNPLALHASHCVHLGCNLQSLVQVNNLVGGVDEHLVEHVPTDHHHF